MIALVKTFLHSQFKIKDLGPLKYFLRREIARSPTGIFVNQRKYACDIFSDTGLYAVKPSVTPIEQNHQLINNNFELLSPSDVVMFYPNLLLLPNVTIFNLPIKWSNISRPPPVKVFSFLIILLFSCRLIVILTGVDVRILKICNWLLNYVRLFFSLLEV